ncbi:MAG: hypothetical protein PUP91_25185 [Rhizonema sp. PD37]|nr:hypothetical protein [Rhizonema sp. PD37]
MREYLNRLFIAGVLLVVFEKSLAGEVGRVVEAPLSSPASLTSPAPEAPESPEASRMDRPLRLSVTVDDESFLQVKEGERIKVGDVITDNKRERDRLTQQRQSISLRIQNLKDKAIYTPFEPKSPIPSKPLPSAAFSEEKAAISHAQLRLVHAQTILKARTAIQGSNREKRVQVDKAEAALKSAQLHVERQQQMIKSMHEMKLQDEILQHESAKLKQVNSELELAESELDSAKAQLQASLIEQQQQLQQLQIAVQLAEAELDGAKSKLIAAKERRRLLEYDANIEEAKRAQIENQTQQEYSRQQQQYEQAVREKDYQLAQLSISLSTVDDKLSLIPVVRSPRSGYIKKIKPWVGNNGKYTTTITISFAQE